MVASAGAILVVDSDGLPSPQRTGLESVGFAVQATRDGSEALRLFRSDRPDLVITELALPGMSGLDLIARVREASLTPLIVLSSSAEEERKVQALRAGADDYLVKPVGADVRVSGRLFTVIGTLESKGGNAFGIEDLQVMVPITTVYYRLSSTRTGLGEITVSSINVQVDDVKHMNEVNDEISTLLFVRHGEEDFTVANQEDTIETLQSMESTFVVLLAAIAGISLLVGGIGIMNIMMVSVAERVREIGIRKAMGAKRRDIAMQFLSEATFLSIGGGIVGVGLGLGVSALIDGLTLGDEELATVFSGDVAILALVVSAAVGLFFGIYPATRAARLHPIEALRHE